jgi:hypothetical protein
MAGSAEGLLRPYDPYGCYGWDQVVVAAGERELLNYCDAAFAISPALADDFRKQTDRPVFVQPNGVSEAFLKAFDGPERRIGKRAVGSLLVALADGSECRPFCDLGGGEPFLPGSNRIDDGTAALSDRGAGAFPRFSDHHGGQHQRGSSPAFDGFGQRSG